jgi:hypothetical protein
MLSGCVSCCLEQGHLLAHKKVCGHTLGTEATKEGISEFLTQINTSHGTKAKLSLTKSITLTFLTFVEQLSLADSRPEG